MRAVFAAALAAVVLAAPSASAAGRCGDASVRPWDTAQAAGLIANVKYYAGNNQEGTGPLANQARPGMTLQGAERRRQRDSVG